MISMGMFKGSRYLCKWVARFNRGYEYLKGPVHKSFHATGTTNNIIKKKFQILKKNASLKSQLLRCE